MEGPAFSRFVGCKNARLALILNAIDPSIGGVIIVGDKGSGKSTLARSFKGILPKQTPFVELPLNATEEALTGAVDIEKAVLTGKEVMEPGVLSRCAGGVLYIDDVNLLNSEIMNRVLGARSRPESGAAAGAGRRINPGEERQAGFILVGSMNPEEGAVSAHVLDRFGLCAVLETDRSEAARLRILKKNSAERSGPGKRSRLDEKLRRAVERAVEKLGAVRIPERILEMIVEACLEAEVEGHRADIAVQRASAAFAALCGDSEVAEKHLRKVMPLALAHRGRLLRTEEQPESAKENPQEPRPDDSDQSRDGASSDRERQTVVGPSDWDAQNETDRFEESEREGEGGGAEEVFPAGDPFGVKRINFLRDRMERRVSGRRTRTRFAGKGGRYVKSTLRRRKDDVAVDATLRAAAPRQIARGRTGRVVISPEDLRYKQRERKMGHLVIFLLDCSGSMGVKKRMIETKAAVLSLLMDCYHKRDKVALAAFRKKTAEVVLPPTSSVELASVKLKDLPSGGKTPLAAALYAAHNIVRQTHIKEPRRRCVVAIVSDGRANQAISDIPVHEEIANCAAELARLRNTDFIVVDTEDKSGFMRTDLAAQLSALLNADYYVTDDLKAEYLVGVVEKSFGRAV